MYGRGNSGPATEVWAIGDRVFASPCRVRGTVAAPRREPNASETHCVWVDWDDGERGYIDPNCLDIVRPRRR